MFHPCALFLVWSISWGFYLGRRSRSRSRNGVFPPSPWHHSPHFAQQPFQKTSLHLIEPNLNKIDQTSFKLAKSCPIGPNLISVGQICAKQSKSDSNKPIKMDKSDKRINKPYSKWPNLIQLYQTSFELTKSDQNGENFVLISQIWFKWTKPYLSWPNLIWLG